MSSNRRLFVPQHVSSKVSSSSSLPRYKNISYSAHKARGVGGVDSFVPHRKHAEDNYYRCFLFSLFFSDKTPPPPPCVQLQLST